MKTRITFEGAVFHVIQHGVSNDSLFIEDSDRTYFFHILNEIHKDLGIVCYAYCLMGNHIHLLIKDSLGKLSEFTKVLFQRYAQFFNLKYKRMGHVFARRFEAKLCLDDTYLLTLSRYIHLNPFKANMVKDIKDYPWSSYNYYISDRKDKPHFLDPTFIIKMFSENLDLGRQSYKKFILDSIERSDSINYPDSIYDIIGDPARLLTLNLNIPIWLKKIIEIPSFSIGEIKDKLAQIKNCKEVKSSEGRKYLIRQLHKKGLTLKEISDLLDCHSSTVSRYIASRDLSSNLKFAITEPTDVEGFLYLRESQLDKL